ncbi:MAG: GGDEF domain-containing protein [Marinicellaceae bacterium]
MHKQLEFVRINDFFSKTKGIYGGLILNIIITSFLVAPYTSLKAIGYWISALIICYIPRVIYTFQYFKAKKLQELTVDNIQQWENKIFINCFLPFIAYSSLVFLPFEGDARIGFMVAALSLISLLVGGSIIYSSSKKILNLYLFTCFSFLIARCLYEGTYHFYLLGIYFLAILIFISRLINTKYNNFIDHIASRLKFEKESLTDPLTGLPNRRHMEIFMEKFMPASRRTGHEFQVVMIDIDYFKKYNDAHGHIQGDKVLVDLATIVNQNIHQSDFFVRYGGEEFILILTAVNSEKCLPFLKKLMLTIENELGLTVSLGIASSSISDNFKQLISLADKALYTSKQNGRNQLSLAKAP